MIRPDLKLICENMLMSEGFQGARVLAIKFVTLYELSSELLSKEVHYDWYVCTIARRGINADLKS